ncbi:MAG: DUF2235 domain-containing protein [Bacteroidales bacterium]|nr:DUF2235 domain-containing protein [Bacteroidales bacterium]
MSKNIIICCDGTGNSYGENNTNVVKLFEIIDRKIQCAYYDPGVGTLSSSLFSSYIYKKYKKIIGLASGYGITKNIEEAYLFLMNNYKEGDKVFLFGFSRGAFTVRALAGMLGKVGLLERGRNNLISYASKMYRTQKNESIAHEFKSTFSRVCKVHFIGVWDTVKSVGIIPPRKFPNTKLSAEVAHARQALAIDEQRTMFQPCVWEEDEDRDIVQKWFAGVHSDIGGYYDEAGLSNITLHWMIEEAVDKGLIINKNLLSNYQPDETDEMHNPLKPYWWVLGWRRRKISPVCIHKSVYLRRQKIKYKAKNLERVIKTAKKF